MSSHLPETKAEAPSTQGIGVFRDNRKRPIHRWYPFVEGYSSALVDRALDEASDSSVVFDPFGGSGTTALTAATRAVNSAFTEVNPYMAWVADVKVNQAAVAARSLDSVQVLRRMAGQNIPTSPTSLDHPLIEVSAKRDYFRPGVAESIVAALDWIDGEVDGPVREIARLAVATSITSASNMVRRTDLRRRRSNEAEPKQFKQLLQDRLREVAEDLELAGQSIVGRATQIGTDAKGGFGSYAPFTLVVTSPPYLNGTNYGRNTKLELLALGYIDSERGLQGLRATEITAGINNVAKRNALPDLTDSVEAVATEIELQTYDQRIPAMVRAYFSEMRSVLKAVHARSAPGAELWLDIGDSRYSGVSVPTHSLLEEIADNVGWSVVTHEIIRSRRSYDGAQLTQSLIRFKRTESS